ncbi:hypothetical protein ANCDUO_24829, partial [Ancylostoma duodenale]
LPTLYEDSFRTMETLPMSHQVDGYVPRLDLDHPFFTDSSLPTSFDEEYLRTFRDTERNA